jgi:hypothetical protein
MTTATFQQLFSEKLKSLGYNYNHNIAADTSFEHKIAMWLDRILKPSKKYKTPYFREYDYRAFATKSTVDIDKIVEKYDMSAYRAEMYDMILNQTLNVLMNSGLIKMKDGSRHYSPGRLFVKG